MEEQKTNASETAQKNKKRKQKKRRRKARRLWLILGIAAVVSVLLAGAGYHHLRPYLIYRSAQDLQLQGDYDGAISQYARLEDYRDAAAQITACDYSKAVLLLEARDYEAAIPAFEALGDYADSPRRILYCRYQIAENILSTGAYDEADAAFTALEDYEDADERAIDVRYQKACALDALCDVVLHAPAKETYRVQEYHLPIYHTLCAMIEAKFFDE